MCNFGNVLLGSFGNSIGSSSPPKNASGTALILFLLLTAPVERNLRHVVVEKDLLKADLNGEELCTRIVRDASSSLFMGSTPPKSFVSTREHSSKRIITQKGNSSLLSSQLLAWIPFFHETRANVLVRLLEYPCHPAWTIAHWWPISGPLVTVA